MALIRPLAWEFPYATGGALEKAKRKKKKKCCQPRLGGDPKFIMDPWRESVVGTIEKKEGKVTQFRRGAGIKSHDLSDCCTRN